MRKSISKFVGNLKSNGDIMNAIRNDIGGAYANDIAIVDGDNIKDVANAILDNDEYVNQFLMGLLNRIGKVFFESRVWSNPLKKFKEGLLEYGEVAEEIFVNKVKQEEYSMWDAEDKQFKIAIPDVRAVYYQMNSQKVYSATINESMLRHAFLSSDGVLKLVNGIIDRMSMEDEVFEFEKMKELFTNYANKNRFYPVVVSAVADETTAKGLIKELRATYRKMQFVNNIYNYMGVRNHSTANTIHLFISADIEALVDVEVLARAFNMEKTDFLGHLTILDTMPVANTYAMMVDATWFRVYDNKIASTVARNEKGLYYNHFLHHWETFAINPFAQAIIFTSTASAITSVNFVDSTGTAEDEFDAYANSTIQLTTKIVVSGLGKKTCNFEITQGADYVAEFTSDGERCQIKIKPNVAVDSVIKVKATSQMDSSKNDTATITIVAPTTLLGSKKNEEKK